LLLHAIVHPADIQDRDGGILLLATLFGMYPFLQTLFADAGYQGPKFHNCELAPNFDPTGIVVQVFGTVPEFALSDESDRRPSVTRFFPQNRLLIKCLR
jgi:hypothetical protein